MNRQPAVSDIWGEYLKYEWMVGDSRTVGAIEEDLGIGYNTADRRVMYLKQKGKVIEAEGTYPVEYILQK